RPVPLAPPAPLQRPAVTEPANADHAEVIAQARMGQFGDVQHDVEADQRPGHHRAGHRAAAENGARRAGAPVSLPHALHALLAHGRGAQAVRAGVPTATDARNVGLPARMPEAGGDARGRFGAWAWRRGHCYLAESSAPFWRSIESDSSTTSCAGRSLRLVCTWLIRSTTSLPSMTSPKMVCLPLRCGVGTTVMKNCEPFVPGPAFAMASRYGRSNLRSGWISSPNL